MATPVPSLMFYSDTATCLTLHDYSQTDQGWTLPNTLFPGHGGAVTTLAPRCCLSPGSPCQVVLRQFLLEIYPIAYSTAILQWIGTRSCSTSTLIALPSCSGIILAQTPHDQLAAPGAVLHVLPAQCGKIKNAGQEGQDAGL